MGFDPTPVEIPTVSKATPRPVTSMDLLTLRDFHGLQISPDGRFVAFVLGQAVYETNSYRSALFVIGTERAADLFAWGLPARHVGMKSTSGRQKTRNGLQTATTSIAP